jgi:ABC-2 type transport system ATP-binding protein
MEDIEETCRRLVILDNGRVLFDGDLVDLQRRIAGERSIEVHLEPGSGGWRPEFAAELEPFGATLVREAPLALAFTVPAETARRFVQHLFDLFQVRDLNVERLPLEHLIREIFRTRRISGEPAQRP